MNTKHRVTTALLLGGVLVTGLTSCSESTADEGNGSGSGPDSLTVPKAGEELFSDTFAGDENKWGVVDDPKYGTADFVDGDYVWSLRGSFSHWLPGVLLDEFDRGELDMREVLVSSSATIEDGDGVIGLTCRETPDTDAQFQWYEFVVRDGYAAIRLSDDAGNIEPLVESEDVDLSDGAVDMEAACVDISDDEAELSFSINGSPILQTTVSDPLGNGVPSLQAWTFPQHEQMDIRWHEFAVHAPAS
jgi:hypothetical protein